MMKCETTVLSLNSLSKLYSKEFNAAYVLGVISRIDLVCRTMYSGATFSALLFATIPRATYQNRCSSQNLLLSASEKKLGQESAASEV